MYLRTQALLEKKLVGKKVSMCFEENRTAELWGSFMPRRHYIKDTLSTELISMQVFGLTDFSDFNSNTTFEKWAAMEVCDFDSVPDEMDTFVLPAGRYAVFLHKGASAAFSETFDYIFNCWMPASGYAVDNRPHFEVLGEKYKNESADSEEEVWIPIR